MTIDQVLDAIGYEKTVIFKSERSALVLFHAFNAFRLQIIFYNGEKWRATYFLKSEDFDRSMIDFDQAARVGKNESGENLEIEEMRKAYSVWLRNPA